MAGLRYVEMRHPHGPSRDLCFGPTPGPQAGVVRCLRAVCAHGRCRRCPCQNGTPRLAPGKHKRCIHKGL